MQRSVLYPGFFDWRKDMKRVRNVAASVVLLSLAGLSSTVVQAQENRHVRVINRASSSIRYLYASNIDRNDWEEDLLGDFRVIAPDHYIDASIDDGTGHCLFDLKAVLYDGRTAVTRNFNVCTNDTWTVTDK
jgi:hypothetical protein